MGVREWRDIRRSEIAEGANVDASSVTLYEQGKSVPSEGVLTKLAAFLGVTPAYLRYGVGEAATPDVGEPGSAYVARVAKEKAAKQGGPKKRANGGRKRA